MTQLTSKKLVEDTGGGCSVCGNLPVVNVSGTYWLCGPCVAERITPETTPFLFPQLSPLGKDCGQGSGHVAVKLLTTDDGTAHACEKCSTMWFVPYGAAVKASEALCEHGIQRRFCSATHAENGSV